MGRKLEFFRNALPDGRQLKKMLSGHHVKQAHRRESRAQRRPDCLRSPNHGGHHVRDDQSQALREDQCPGDRGPFHGRHRIGMVALRPAKNMQQLDSY